MVVSYKTKHTLTTQCSNNTPWYLPKGAENLSVHRIFYADVYSSFIHNCQNVEATKIPSMGEWISGIYSDNGILLSTKKKLANKP